MTTIHALNALEIRQAQNWFMQICTASKWCEKMVKSRPFLNKDDLINQAKAHWQAMQRSDFLEAFEGHPMIGDVNSLRKKYAATKTLAGNEQAGTSVASSATLESLHTINHEYLKKHGFIFIICATGLSAQKMLSELRTRLPNSTENEIQIAAQEQLKISLLRIDKAIEINAAIEGKLND